MSRLRVINLGLPKSGTTTLARALRKAGLHVADHRIKPMQTDNAALHGRFVGEMMYDGYFLRGDPLEGLDDFDGFAEINALRGERSIWPQFDFGLIEAIRAHHPGARFTRLQEVLNAKRAQLLRQGVLYARSPGPKNHTRLYMAASDPGAVDALRFGRGYADPARQAALRDEVSVALQKEVESQGADHLVLSAHQLGSGLVTQSELARLHAMLAPLTDRIRVIAHVECPARMLARAYAAQVMDGRTRSLDMRLAAHDDWWQAALATRPESAGDRGIFPEVQMAPAWLDFAALRARWDEVFGKGSFAFRPLDRAALAREDVTEEVRDMLGLSEQIGKQEAARLPRPPSAEWLARARQFNDLLTRLLAQGAHEVPRQMWKKLTGELRIDGAPLVPGALSPIAQRFAPGLAALAQEVPALGPVLTPDAPAPDWQEAEITRGFRAAQYLLAALPRVDRATRQARRAAPGPGPETAEDTGLSQQAARVMPPLAKQKFAQIKGGPFAPHNRLGRVNEEELAAAFAPMPPRDLPEGSSGNVIVGCMKNEGPYVLEWVAYHRAIGVDNFLIYTNGCADGTDEILTRLQELGHVQHRDNEDWKGKSPQQHALNGWKIAL